jgi:RimJ/RimL family protein N-acetyltransferase
MDEPPFTVTIPRLTTPRLLLREYREADFDAFDETMRDPAATKFLTGVPDRRSAWRSFTSGAGQWVVHGAGWWPVELRETGEVAGWVGAFFRETSPHLELGWVVRPKLWRRGVATEAAKAALAHGIAKHDPRRIVAHISKGNVGSVKVSESLGMRYEGEIAFYDAQVGLYVLDR